MTDVKDMAEITIRGMTVRLEEAEFADLAEQVDRIRGAGLTGMPPFERLKEALLEAHRIGELEGNEKQVWELVTDRVKAIDDSGLLKACGLEYKELWPSDDLGYRDEIRSICLNIRCMVRDLEKLIEQKEAPSSHYW